MVALSQALRAWLQSHAPPDISQQALARPIREGAIDHANSTYLRAIRDWQ
jgi:hypothetical protein